MGLVGHARALMVATDGDSDDDDEGTDSDAPTML